MLKKTVLRKNKEISCIYNKGKSQGSKYIVFFYKKNGLEYNRTCVLASKKVGNSVKRNRARRLIKASYFKYKDRIEKGFDLIFIARKDIVNVKCEEVEKSMYSLFKRSNLF
ncbi:MAG: ribonuclease P protein component [Candidatus Fimenecus sp.]